MKRRSRKFAPRPHTVDRLWTAEDVMEFLGIGSSTFFTLRSLGKMAPPVTKVGNALRFHPAEVKAWACAGSPSVTEWEAAKRRDKNLFDREKFKVAVRRGFPGSDSGIPGKGLSMADVYKPTYHALIPPDAKIVERGGKRFARFSSKTGKVVEGLILPCGTRCRVETPCYYARIREASGRVRRVPLGVTDLEAARQLRAKLQREADQLKAGIVDEFAAHRRTPLIGSMNELPKRKHQRNKYGRIVRLASELARDDLKQAIDGSHLGDFVVHLQATGRSTNHIWETARVIRRLVIACRFQFADDLDASALDRYLVSLSDNKKSRRTRNGALKAIRSLVAWMIRSNRLPSSRDPFRGITTVNEEADPRRRFRRALTPEEFALLLHATEQADSIEANSGPMRAMLYLIAAWTGLRRKELASLTLVHLSLDSDPPYIHVPIASTKAKRDDQPIPLNPVVAKRLGDWLSTRTCLRGETVFNLTTPTGRLRKTSKMMQLDCKAAGVAYQSSQGLAHFASHRRSFITALSRTCRDFSLVSELARHRDPKLTAKIYDKVRLEDRTAAIGAMTLPTGAAAGKRKNRSTDGAARSGGRRKGKRTA